MKKETMQNKLLDILGLHELKSEPKQAGKPKTNNNKFVGISEDEIQEFRARQGLIYFLQAPQLFSAKICKHCGAGFMVSRQFVGYCSYTCIEKSLEEVGITWSRRTEEGIDIDQSYIDRNYDGNEPIWVRDLDVIEQLINSVKEKV